MIEIEQLSFSYRKNKILEEVSFTVPRGCCTGLIGANGCGKSTLLSILAGCRKAQGTMRLTEGGQAYALSKSKRPEGIGYVPQDNPLLEDLSGLDNLLLWYQKSAGQLQKTLSQPVMQMLAVEPFLRKPVKQLSGGMKKRLSLAIGLINEPRLLILDEPTAALDIPCKYDVHRYMKEYLKSGGTILITTHEAEELKLSQKVLLLKDAAVSEIQPPYGEEELNSYFSRTPL